MNNLTDKLKIAMAYTKVSQIELARRTEQSKSNLSQNFLANNFKLSEYEKLIKALGCKLEIKIVLSDGTKI